MVWALGILAKLALGMAVGPKAANAPVRNLPKSKKNDSPIYDSTGKRVIE